MRLLMSRHGETIANSEKKFQGWHDTPLTPAGIKAAEDLRDFLKDQKIDLVACSPIGRVKATAAIVVKDRDIPIVYYDELKELNFGDWDGRTLASLEQEPLYQVFFNEPDKFTAPNGENFQELHQRVIGKIRELYQEHHDKTLLIIAHGLTLRVAMNHFYGYPLSQLREKTKFLYSCSLSIVDYFGDDDIRVIVEGSTEHLSNVVG